MNDQFDKLVENSLFYFEKAINEFDDEQQFATIHFYAAVELLLKARLFCEHWSLIADNVDSISSEDLLSGNFKSVTLEVANKRLIRIAGAGIQKSGFSHFVRLKNIRNKMIHFHSSHPIEDTAALISNVWLILHSKINSQWSDCFSKHISNFRETDVKMHKIHRFLKAKFESMKHIFEGKSKSGVTFTDCPSCKNKSLERSIILGELFHVSCIVCNVRTDCLIFECQDCDGNIYVEEEFEGKCSDCDIDVNEDLLFNRFGEKLSHRDISQGACSQESYCSECDHMEHFSVVPFNDKFLCLNCFYVSDSIDHCEYCNTAWNHFNDDSFWSGCNICDGKRGDIEHM